MKTRLHKKNVRALTAEECRPVFWSDWDYDLLKYVQIRQRQGMSKKTYADCIIMADTETSRKTENPTSDEDHHNHVCAWSVAIRAYHQNIVVLWGTRPSEMADCFENIRSHLPADDVFIFFHNLPYDWVFLRKFLFRKFGNPSKQLNVKPLYPLQIRFDNGLVLRDSLMIAQRSLEKWCEDMQVEHAKAVGKWEYAKIRHQKTFRPTRDELLYMCNDVLGGVECLDATIVMLHKTLGSLPLTATGIVRNEAREAGRQFNAHDWAVKILPETYDEIEIQELCYHGGYTHGNKYAMGILFPSIYKMCKDFVKCKDFSSSYPFTQLSEKFPAERFWKPKRKTFTADYVLSSMEDFAFIFLIKVKDLKLRNERDPMPVISSSKCIISLNAVTDNGRVRSADYVELYVNEIDFKLIYDQYVLGDNLIIENMRAAYKDYLPRWFTDYVYKRYELKCRLKGVDPVLYAIEKAKLNSIYGMTAQKTVKDDLEELYEDREIDGELHKAGEYLVKEGFDREEEYKKYLKNRNTFLPYCLGIWVTSYAQRNLFRLGACVPEGEIWIYSDTDSVYATDFDEDKLKAYNDECKKKLLDRGYGAVVIDGHEYWLGVAEDDGIYAQFKALHAKCYCKRKLIVQGDNFVIVDRDIKITVAGVPKKGFKSLGNDINKFKDGFLFDGETSGKLQHYHYFIDEIYEDADGNETGDSIDLQKCDYVIKPTGDTDANIFSDFKEVDVIEYEEAEED